jgi:5-formyltetrahydrofolate cyclo-ligase
MPDFASDAENIRSAKFALRNQLIAARSLLTSRKRRSAAVEVQAATTSLVREIRPSTIAAYVPVGTEPGGPDLPEVLARELPPDGRLLLPLLLDDGDLDWARYDGSLVAGRGGLREPGGDRLGVDAVRSADLVIVPALAIDRQGIRLGRGGGSYDRALARISASWTVALLHDGELIEHVPAEPHDRPVRAAITPSGGLTLSRGPEWTN